VADVVVLPEPHLDIGFIARIFATAMNQSISQAPAQFVLAGKDRPSKTKKPENPPACIEKKRSTSPGPPVHPGPRVPLCEPAPLTGKLVKVSP